MKKIKFKPEQEAIEYDTDDEITGNLPGVNIKRLHALETIEVNMIELMSVREISDAEGSVDRNKTNIDTVWRRVEERIDGQRNYQRTSKEHKRKKRQTNRSNQRVENAIIDIINHIKRYRKLTFGNVRPLLPK